MITKFMRLFQHCSIYAGVILLVNKSYIYMIIVLFDELLCFRNTIIYLRDVIRYIVECFFSYIIITKNLLI